MSESWTYLLSRPELSFSQTVVTGAVRGQRVLITGAGGSIGTHLAGRIAALKPDRLLLLDSHEASLWRLRQTLGDRTPDAASSAGYILADVRDRAKLETTLRRNPTDIIFHLAAYKHVALAEENVDQTVAVNLLGSLNVIESAKANRVRTVVLPTTDKTVNPTSLYGCTKRVLERIARAAAAESPPDLVSGASAVGEARLPALRVARLVNVLGSQGSVVEVFARQIRRGEPVSVTDAATDRYYITMDEAVSFLLGVAAQADRAGIYGLEAGAPIRTIDLANRIHRQIGSAERASPEIRVIGLQPGERRHEELVYADETRRATSVPGIWALDAPPEEAPFTEWIDELESLRRGLYDWEPSELRAHLFAVIRARRPGLARAIPAGRG